MIYPGAGLPGRQNADGNRKKDCHQDTGNCQRYCGFQSLRDEFGHRHFRENRVTQVAAGHVGYPFSKLDVNRLVEPQFFADTFDIFGHGITARDHGRRIARSQVQKQKYKNGDHPRHGNSSQQAPNYICPHLS
jgi:hypothetical protein